MTYRAHVKNGQIVLDEPVRLDEGDTVLVEVLRRPPLKQRPEVDRFPPVEMPGGPLSDDIIRDRR